ncbi:hypothetical protein [Pseudogemmobacter sonorensis]
MSHITLISGPVKASHLSSWRTSARQGKLIVPEVVAAEFAAPLAAA